jgi:uncharacterized protein (TIGR03032 family)
MVDGRPRWLSALGETNKPQGWRENKTDGGILIDLSSNTIVARGLSMPHSPRWYQNRLWLLESGRGALIQLDPATGEKSTVARLPGFARGLSFAGPLAFIGLSQLRESNTFTDIPITDELDRRACGVWIVHIETGEIVALLRFEDAVQEIFAVEAAPVRFPELVGLDNKLIQSTFVLPDEALAEAQFSTPDTPEASNLSDRPLR